MFPSFGLYAATRQSIRKYSGWTLGLLVWSCTDLDWPLRTSWIVIPLSCDFSLNFVSSLQMVYVVPWYPLSDLGNFSLNAPTQRNAGYFKGEFAKFMQQNYILNILLAFNAYESSKIL